MIEWPRISNLLFLDIETISSERDYASLDPRLKIQWDRKAQYLPNEDALSTNELYNQRAGIYAEFGKVIVVGVGYFHKTGEDEVFLRVKSIAGHEEAQVLTEFKNLLSHFDQDVVLCAHNGKEFDFPYLCRRMLINGIPLPESLNISGKKPWEVNHLDTMNMWKFGDWKSYTSLELLAAVFDVKGSKEDMDGSMVNDIYYEQNDLQRIADYCMNDVAVTARVFLKMSGMDDLPEDRIIFV